MKLVWSLVSRDKSPHSQYIYDMFYLSIQMAKDLGYETILYGTIDAEERLSEFVDKFYNVDFLDYKLYDDCKFYIWETRNDDYAIIDGDIFLFSKIEFQNCFVNYDMVVEKCGLDYMKKGLDILNDFGIKDIVGEWNTESQRSFSSGIIKWNSNNRFLKYYIQSYYKLRNWYFQNEEEITKKSSELIYEKSLLSHFLCEHLLERMVNFYGVESNELRGDSYIHWQGLDKFKNPDKVELIKQIVTYHKTYGGTIKSVYDTLLNQNKIKPLFYLSLS